MANCAAASRLVNITYHNGLIAKLQRITDKTDAALSDVKTTQDKEMV